LAEQILLGKTPNIPGAVLAAGEFVIEYDDGTKLENVYLVDPVLVTQKNLSVLIQSGRYSSDEVRRLSK